MYSLQISQSHGEIGNLEALRDYPKLYSLLLMMGEVIDVQSQRTLTKGTLIEGGYIGYNIQDSRYCFYIYFCGKECKLIFMTWHCKIDIEQCKGRFGQVVKNEGPVRWRDELNLNKPSVQFFSAAGSAESQIQIQIQIIGKFYRRSYEFVQQIIMKE